MVNSAVLFTKVLNDNVEHGVDVFFRFEITAFCHELFVHNLQVAFGTGYDPHILYSVVTTDRH